MLIRKPNSNGFIIIVVVGAIYFMFYGVLCSFLGIAGFLIGWNFCLLGGIIATYIRNKQVIKYNQKIKWLQTKKN